MHTFGPEPCEECKKMKSDYIEITIKTFFKNLFYKNIVMVFIVGTITISIFYSKFGVFGVLLGAVTTILFMCATQSVQ